ncbi:MAG: hypothetical protein QF473_11935 [Planctomycetota bacterium]|nr:hypothetical protein [Planctomycetota bacterium]
MEEFKVVDADSFPESVARPETPPNPNIVTARDGVGVKYPGCDGMGNRIVHPDNPKAPSKNFGVVMFYVPPHVKLDTGAHPNEECYVIQRGSGVMTLTGSRSK